MLHAAAMLTVFFGLWLLGAQRVSAPEDFAIAAGAAFVCVLIGARLGGVAPNPFGRAPHFFALSGARARAVLRGALGTIRAAIAADVTLKPALVRVRTRPSSDFAKAAFADMIGAAPGAVVVDTDTDGLLVHVIDEDAIDATALGELEARVVGAIDGSARS